jgi:hypothetical protein
MSSGGPRVVEFGIIGPYGSATPAADMLAWAQTMVFAATGRPPSTMADLDVLPGPLRETVRDCLSGDPSLRPRARSVVADLIDSAEPTTQALAEGARRAAEATYAADEARAERQAPQARGSQTAAGGQGSRSARSRSAHSRSAPPGGQSRGRRSGALPIAAALVVIVAVGFVILHVMQNASGGGSSAAAPGSDPPSSATSPVSSTVTAPASPAPAAVPAAFAGSWSGAVTQPSPTDEFEVKLGLTSGSADGSISYSSTSLSCSGDLSLKSASPSRKTIVLSQGIVTGQRACANGSVTLTRGATSGSLSFHFRGQSGPQASGTLTRN